MKPTLCLTILSLVPFIAAIPAAIPEGSSPLSSNNAPSHSPSTHGGLNNSAPGSTGIAVKADHVKRVGEVVAKREEEDPEYDYIIIQKEKV